MRYAIDWNSELKITAKGEAGGEMAPGPLPEEGGEGGGGEDLPEDRGRLRRAQGRGVARGVQLHAGPPRGDVAELLPILQAQNGPQGENKLNISVSTKEV